MLTLCQTLAALKGSRALNAFTSSMLSAEKTKSEPIMGASAYSNRHDSVLILYLALVTGLAALTLYYYGLQRTPAVLSSLAELTYPAVAVVAGIYAYDQHLSWTQWLGVALILGTVTLLPVRRRRIVAEKPRDLVPAAAPATG